MAECIPFEKLVCFALHKKITNVGKTHQLTPGISTAILGVAEPHYDLILNSNRYT
jgi:hypothetical protein